MNQDASFAERRRFLRWLTAWPVAMGLLPAIPLLAAEPIRRRAIPSTGETIPVIGMGSWITFDVDMPDAIERRVPVLRTFFELGGGLVDSSPMYGSAEKVIGHCLRAIENDQTLFAATKVWIHGRNAGIEQMEASRKLWGVPRFDLMQIHNLLDWETHLETLKAWKQEGRIRYLGLTTSHGRRHEELARVMRTQPLDFVQFTYNTVDREAEKLLLPLAQDRGIAVIINRPFQRGALFSRVRGKPLPSWAPEIGCANWAQFFLKFIVSHPAVTCAIPATTQVAHMRENMGAGYGVLPDDAQRRRMLAYFDAIR